MYTDQHGTRHRIYVDCSGDACPADRRYENYLTRVMAAGLPLRERWSVSAIADRMVAMAKADNNHTHLCRESCIYTAQMETNAS